jgi:DNA-binding transcriptional ArsR family regulator
MRPSTATPALSALRRRLLDQLAEPVSASELARRLGLPRQRVNYHLRELERLGLAELVDQRQRRGFVERRLRAAARDRFSSAYLLSAAARLAGDVATLRERAQAAGERLATVTVEVEVDLPSPAALRAFAGGLADAIGRLAAEHHRPADAHARPYRVVLGVHPAAGKPPASAEGAGRRLT